MEKRKDKIEWFEKFAYLPSEKQALVHQSSARFRIVAAGARFGKSMLAGAEAAALFLEPGRRIWIVGTQYELSDREFQWAIDFLSHLRLDGVPILHYCKITNAQRGAREISSPWGSFIRTKSAEKPQTLLGEELDMLILSEASQFPRSVWDRMLRARIGPRNGKVLAISTPNSDGGLFYDFYKKAEAKESDWQCWKFKTIDNPHYSPEEYEKQRKEMDKKVFDEQCEGEFVSRRGLVFTINPLLKIAGLPPESPHWPVILGIQRGYKNPTAIVFCAVDQPGKKIYVYDEIYEAEKTLLELVPLIGEKLKGKTFRGCVCDFWDTDTQTELKKFSGISVNSDEKKIGKTMAQIRRIQCLQNALTTANGGRIFFCNVPKTLNDFERAKWNEAGKEEKERPEAELPQSKYMQAPTALAHVVSFLDVIAGYDPYHVR